LTNIGIIEGFFGPEWNWASRKHICKSMRSHGGSFYIYAPKRDPFLRKNWTDQHPDDLWSELKRLSATCKENNIRFGVGLSPFELHSHWNEEYRGLLQKKIAVLNELDFDMLGLFFDDMRSAPDLADRQIEIIDFVQNLTSKNILFCPTYYTPDPILDKVFGQRSPDYLAKIGTIHKDIEILWTGSKVIPDAISGQELKDVAKIINRKPFVWDNFYANDGPRQCMFLKLKPLLGRSVDALQESAGWAFNLMNQPNLSEFLFIAAIEALNDRQYSDELFLQASKRCAGVEIEALIKQFGAKLLQSGLDKIDEGARAEIRSKLVNNRFCDDIRDWLDGKYIVGPECLTD
jgi:hypothetical protein